MVSAPARASQVAFAQKRGLSCRRACRIVDVSRSTVTYQSRMAAKDGPILAAMIELASKYPRYGYRRIRIFLERQGMTMSEEKAHRLWRLAGLQVPKKSRKRRIKAPRPRPKAPRAPNDLWACDFVFDGCANGQKLKCFTLIDEFTRESLAIEVDGSLKAQQVVSVLSRVAERRGLPGALRCDNGPEFIAMALLRWCVNSGVEPVHIDPGKPWQNGMDESFNGRFRDECLNLEWFRTRAEAKPVIEEWRKHYNAVRPHSSLKNLTPNEFRLQYENANPPLKGQL
jgi:putative transposase